MRRKPLVSNIRQIHRAFTFIELVIVLVIVGIMSAVAVPRLTGSLARIQLDAAKRRVEIDLAQTQRRARFTGMEQEIDFKVSDSNYLIKNMNDPDHAGQIYTVELNQEPYNATIIAADFGGSTSLTYDGFGQPDNAGYITLDVGGKRVNILIAKKGLFATLPIDPG